MNEYVCVRACVRACGLIPASAIVVKGKVQSLSSCDAALRTVRNTVVDLSAVRPSIRPSAKASVLSSAVPLCVLSLLLSSPLLASPLLRRRCSCVCAMPVPAAALLAK